MASPLNIISDFISAIWADEPGIPVGTNGSSLGGEGTYSGPIDLITNDQYYISSLGSSQVYWDLNIAGTGKRAFNFSDINSSMFIYDPSPGYDIAHTDITVGTAVIVGRITGASGDLLDGSPRHLLDSLGGQWRMFADSLLSGGTSDTNLHLFIAEFDSNNSRGRLWVDGTLVLDGAAGGATNGNLFLGSSQNGEHYGSEIAFFGYADRVLTATERQNFYAWYQSEYFDAAQTSSLPATAGANSIRSVRFGNTEITKIYKGQTLLYSNWKDSVTQYHSIVTGAYPGTPAGYSDAGDTIILAEAFYRLGSSTTNWRVAGGKVWIPTGLNITGPVTFMAYKTPYDTLPDFSMEPDQYVTLPAAGQNQFSSGLFSAPFTVDVGSNEIVWIAYTFGNNSYAFVPDSGISAGPAYRAQDGAAIYRAERLMSTNSAVIFHVGTTTYAPSNPDATYAVDIIVDEGQINAPIAPTPPWINRTVASHNGNGTNSSTFTFTQPSAGNLIVAIVGGPVTCTTPVGFTMSEGTVLNNGLYAFTKISDGTETSFTTTHNGTDYPVACVVYEFSPGVVSTSANDNFVSSSGGYQPAVSGYGPNAILLSAKISAEDQMIKWRMAADWTAATEDYSDVIYSVNGDAVISIAYSINSDATWQPRCDILTTSGSVTPTAEAITIAINLS